MMVMVPRPGVCRRVKLETALPEMPGWSADTRGAHANSPTGCRTGRDGRIRTRALMSASVAPPSSPSGFSSANGHTTPAGVGDGFLRLPLLSSAARPNRTNKMIDPEYVLECERTVRVRDKTEPHLRVPTVSARRREVAAQAAGPSGWQRCTAAGPRTGRCRVGPRGSSTRTGWVVAWPLPGRGPSRKSSSRGRHLQSTGD
jgi:hypothetical protein